MQLNKLSGRVILNCLLFISMNFLIFGSIVCEVFLCMSFQISICLHHLKSLGPIDRKFHGHGENDGFVLYEYIIKQCSRFCKYTNISVMKKNVK